jgi:integrase
MLLIRIKGINCVPVEVRQTLEQLPLREATMALVDAVTALRASELIALKLKNVGWETGVLQSESALVEGELKETKSGSNPLPLGQPVLDVLRLWRNHTAYRSDEDWIFASPHYHGKTPYTYQILFHKKVVRMVLPLKFEGEKRDRNCLRLLISKRNRERLLIANFRGALAVPSCNTLQLA